MKPKQPNNHPDLFRSQLSQIINLSHPLCQLAGKINWSRIELERFAQIWDEKYPQISRHWPNLTTFFDYPKDIGKAIETTNAIESLNSVIRNRLKPESCFPVTKR